MTAAASPHRPGCQCGGTGVIEGPTITAANDRSTHPRPYRQLVDCPGPAWPTPPPTRTAAVDIGRRGIAAARAALNPTKEAS